MENVRRTKAYLAEMSSGTKIPIDHDELDKVIEDFAAGKQSVVRGGMINPSFCADIILDQKRTSEWIRETNYAGVSGERSLKAGMQPIENIFKGTNIEKKMLAAAENRKVLGAGNTQKKLPGKE